MALSSSYRRRVNSLAIVASAAFAGGNLLIGLSMGAYWLSLDPIEYMNGFWPLFVTFLNTIVPLFALTLVGLVLSARLDWSDTRLRRLWLIAIGCYAATSLITLRYHLAENLRLREASYTIDRAASVRRAWLLWHVPRVVLAFAIPLLSVRAVFLRCDNNECR